MIGRRVAAAALVAAAAAGSGARADDDHPVTGWCDVLQIGSRDEAVQGQVALVVTHVVAQPQTNRPTHVAAAVETTCEIRFGSIVTGRAAAGVRGPAVVAVAVAVMPAVPAEACYTRRAVWVDTHVVADAHCFPLS